MSSLSSLEQDVYQFLRNLAGVRKVDVKSSSVRGKKRMNVCTYMNGDTSQGRLRVHRTEDLLRERHQSVFFSFHCSTLKETHARNLGTPQTA